MGCSHAITVTKSMAPSAGVEPTILPLGGVCIIHYATRAGIPMKNSHYCMCLA